MDLNPRDTKNAISEFLQMLNYEDDELDKELKSAKYKIKDYNRLEYYYYPGIPIKIEARRDTQIKIASENVSRVDITIIELID